MVRDRRKIVRCFLKIFLYNVIVSWISFGLWYSDDYYEIGELLNGYVSPLINYIWGLSFFFRAKRLVSDSTDILVVRVMGIIFTINAFFAFSMANNIFYTIFHYPNAKYVLLLEMAAMAVIAFVIRKICSRGTRGRL